ncbi:DNA N-6-adenine-methyltransferase [Psychrobacter sp. W2-37-MNA-CIBAN-0211]|uniref:DNA N-6-adenine-methyltransferase n=1 Tax=Psychrobacter sp. W2-37-MNA-CIBAN-0211 TaxID=3140443 RepID=UPI00333131F8
MDVSFEREDQKDEWLTPPDILAMLGDFDLDPCSPIGRPWDTAANHYTVADDGFHKEWAGRVFCNPPYGTETKKWLNKCADHGDCVALVYARTETKMFFESIWNKASAIFFFKGRLRFYSVDGIRGGTAGAPSVLIAYGKDNAEFLKNIGIAGCYIDLTDSVMTQKVAI